MADAPASEILVTHAGTAPPLTDPYYLTYPPSSSQGAYGPRQNYDFLNPYCREKTELVSRQIAPHYTDHLAVIGWQIDNETAPTGVSTRYTYEAFVARLKCKYETTARHAPYLVASSLFRPRRQLWRCCLARP